MSKSQLHEIACISEFHIEFHKLNMQEWTSWMDRGERTSCFKLQKRISRMKVNSKARRGQLNEHQGWNKLQELLSKERKNNFKCRFMRTDSLYMFLLNLYIKCIWYLFVLQEIKQDTRRTSSRSFVSKHKNNKEEKISKCLKTLITSIA